MGYLNEKLVELNRELIDLRIRVLDLNMHIEEGLPLPYTKHGELNTDYRRSPIGTKTGLGRKLGGPMVWNDSILKNPPLNEKPDDATKGYNKHSHSEFSGGALDINTLELIEYDVNWELSFLYNKDCQDYWDVDPPIKIVQNSNGENVEKKGKIGIEFNPDTQTWEAGQANIDVKNTYLVMRDSNGNIMIDSRGNEMKAPLYNSDSTKTSVIWDSNAGVWRFYAVYK